MRHPERKVLKPFQLEHSFYCNYFVANDKFWDLYFDFMDPIILTYIKKLDQGDCRLLRKVYNKQSSDAGYLPFIIERLLPPFIEINARNIKVKKIKLSELTEKRFIDISVSI